MESRMSFTKLSKIGLLNCDRPAGMEQSLSKRICGNLLRWQQMDPSTRSLLPCWLSMSSPSLWSPSGAGRKGVVPFGSIVRQWKGPLMQCVCVWKHNLAIGFGLVAISLTNLRCAANFAGSIFSVNRRLVIACPVAKSRNEPNLNGSCSGLHVQRHGSPFSVGNDLYCHTYYCTDVNHTGTKRNT